MARSSLTLPRSHKADRAQEAFTPSLHGAGQAFEHLDALLPPEAAVGDALPMHQRHSGHELLATAYEMAFDHDADDAPISHLDLSADIGDDKGLVFGFLAAVAVTRIDHHRRAKAGAFDLAASGFDIFGVVIRG